MADIPLFQYQGSSINPTASPVSSLLDSIQARQAGTEVGLKVPNTTGAIFSGINDAYQTYQKNSLIKAQTEAYEADTALHNAQSAMILSGTVSSKDQAEADLKRAQASSAQDKVNGQLNMQQLAQDISTGDPVRIKAAFNNPGVLKVMFDNAKDAPVILGMAAAKIGNDPEGQQMLKDITAGIKNAQFANGKQTIDDQIKNHAITTGIKAMKDVIDDGLIHQLAPNERDPGNFLSKHVAYPVGKKSVVNVDGKTYLDPQGAEGNQVNLDNWDVFNTETNQRIGSLPKDKAIKLNTARNGYTSQLEELYRKTFPEENLTGPIPTIRQPGQAVATQSSSSPVAEVPGTNKAIVDQTTESLNKGTFIPGVNASSVTDALKKQKIQMWQKKWEAQGKVLPEVPSTPVTPSKNPVNFVPTPNESLSAASPVPLTLKIGDTFKVHPTVYNRVNGNPYLANQEALVKGLASVESLGITEAQSPRVIDEKGDLVGGVRGLLQVTKPTAKQYGFDRDIPEENVAAGSRHIKELITHYNGNLQLAIAAYNIGDKVIDEAVETIDSKNWSDVKQYLKVKSLEGDLSKNKYDQVEHFSDKVITAMTQFISPTDPRDKLMLSLLAYNNLITAKKA